MQRVGERGLDALRELARDAAAALSRRSVSTPAARAAPRRAMSSLASRLASSAPSAATARLPPIERKNWIVAVAIAEVGTATAFCVAMM